MWKLAVLLGVLTASGCGVTSYGASTDGTFPPRPAGADYPNWEHVCFVFTGKNATEVLQGAGDKGWELVALGNQGSDGLMCFKRPKPHN